MDSPKINILSLFTGIGGLDIGVGAALDYLGYKSRLVACCERDSYCQATLMERMEAQALDPAPICSDLADLPRERLRGLVDLLIGGPPCQPVSNAGCRRGDKDDRFLWPQALGLVEDIQPRVVFFENVQGWLSEGYAADVVARLETLGYLVAPPLRLRAPDVGAPQRQRMRVFVMAVAMQSVGPSIPGCVPEDETRDAGGRPRSGYGAKCSSEDVGGSTIQVASADQDRRDAGPREPCRQFEGRRDADRCHSGMGRATSQGREGLTTAGSERKQPGGRCGSVGGTDHKPIRCESIRSRCRQSQNPHRDADSYLALYPPPDGPGAFGAWADLFRTGHCDLAPALPQSAVHGLADGPAVWMGAIRATGNAVVPLQAAIAFVYLWRFLEIGGSR